MVFRTTPQLGPGLEDTITETGVWFSPPTLNTSGGGLHAPISPELGTRESGSDGHVYILCQASAVIAAAAAPGTEVIITEPTFRAATGDGGFFAPIAGVPDEGYFWARRELI